MASPRLCREAFQRTIRVVALRTLPQHCNELQRAARAFMLREPKLKPIRADTSEPDSPMRLILLRPDVNEDLHTLPEALRKRIAEVGAGTITMEVQVGYEQLRADEVLRQVLPEGVDVPTGYEVAGHVAHLNLREEQLPYKHVIGQVVLDKSPGVRTVVNKVSTIASQFRTFPLELLAGEDDLNVEVREGGATFRFNFGEVYWNSRLQTEHGRVLEGLAADDIICAWRCVCAPLRLARATCCWHLWALMTTSSCR